MYVKKYVHFRHPGLHRVILGLQPRDKAAMLVVNTICHLHIEKFVRFQFLYVSFIVQFRFYILITFQMTSTSLILYLLILQ